MSHGWILIRAGVTGHDQHQAMIRQQIRGFFRRHGAEDLVGVEIDPWRASGETQIKRDHNSPQSEAHNDQIFGALVRNRSDAATLGAVEFSNRGERS